MCYLLKIVPYLKEVNNVTKTKILPLTFGGKKKEEKHAVC